MKKADRQLRRPAPVPGMVIVEPDFRLSGEEKGRASKRTKRQLRALERARRRTKAEKALVAGGPDAAATVEAYSRAAEGDLGPLTRLSMLRLGRMSLLHDAAVQDCEENGLLVEETTLDSEGRVASVRKKINPLADFSLRSAEAIGVNSDALQVTPKSLGEGRKSQALTEWIERDRLARESLKLNAVTVEVLPDSAAEKD